MRPRKFSGLNSSHEHHVNCHNINELSNNASYVRKARSKRNKKIRRSHGRKKSDLKKGNSCLQVPVFTNQSKFSSHLCVPSINPEEDDFVSRGKFFDYFFERSLKNYQELKL